LAERKTAIFEKVKEYQKNVLHPIKSTLILEISANQGYFVLKDISINEKPSEREIESESLHISYNQFRTQKSSDEKIPRNSENLSNAKLCSYKLPLYTSNDVILENSPSDSLQYPPIQDQTYSQKDVIKTKTVWFSYAKLLNFRLFALN